MTFYFAILIASLYAFQSTHKPYSSHKQSVHSWDVFMASPEARAAAEQLHGKCGDADNQATMNACFSADYSKADASLHHWYDLQLKQLKASDRLKFIQVQRLWLMYREADCKLEAAQAEGGSLQPTLFYSCMKEKTTTRQIEIESNYQSEL